MMVMAMLMSSVTMMVVAVPMSLMAVSFVAVTVRVVVPVLMDVRHTTSII
jgi:hypothetical protein